MTVAVPALPANAAATHTLPPMYSGEGLDAVDDFNDVSTDGGATWSDAIVVTADSSWATIANTKWISSDASSGTGRENSTTLFRRQFGLPPGVTGSTGQLCVHADNAVSVTFNGAPVLTQSNTSDPENYSNDPTCSTALTNATSGVNTLLFTVQNGAGPLGLDFRFDLTYTHDDDALPLINVPGNITVAATGPSGAVVNYNVSGVDVTGFSLLGTCTPPSNTLFAPGTTTTVTCTVTGVNGQTSGSFTVTVLPLPTPNQAPVLALPADITVNTNVLSGKAVSFTVTATDDSGLPPTVVCLPPSGSVFPVGVTTVTCTATDDQGLSSSGTFTVTVIGPLERACALLQQSLGITLKTRLVTTLRAAADQLHLARRYADEATVRGLALTVKNSGGTYVRPALRSFVVQKVTWVMGRVCCPPTQP